MKILVIEPIRRWRWKENGRMYTNLEEYFNETYKIKNSIDFDIEILSLLGTDIIPADRMYHDRIFFSESDIEQLREKIDMLINLNELLGIVISPFFTYKEYELIYYVSEYRCGTIEHCRFECIELSKIYDRFSEKVPFYIKGDGGLLFGGPLPYYYRTDIYDRISADQKKLIQQGEYYHETINFEYQLGFEEMLNYFIEFHNKKQKTKVKS